MVWTRRLLLVLIVVGIEAVFLSATAYAQRAHRVRSGDSMSAIAKKYGIDLWDLALANDLKPKSRIRPGQTLTIPPKGVVYIRPGHTLSTIAKENDTTTDELRKRNRLKPGQTLQIGDRLWLPGYEPRATARRRARRSYEASEHPGVVQLVRKGEKSTLRLVDPAGRVSTEAVEQLALIMRRHAEDGDETRKPDPRLLAVLAAISDHFEGREITLVSGFREVSGYTRETSRHVAGQATDIRLEGVPNRALWDFCRSLANTGCGYYPRSSFVHIDVRESTAQWVDWSRPGKRPRYGTLARPYRKRERRSAKRPRVGRQVTRAALVPTNVELANISANPALPAAPKERKRLPDS